MKPEVLTNLTKATDSRDTLQYSGTRLIFSDVGRVTYTGKGSLEFGAQPSAS